MYREVSPSAPPYDMSLSICPGIVYDYVGIYNSGIGKIVIFGGHNINDPAKIYRYGLDKRPTRGTN
jgi:hypothetical protein